MAGTVYVLMGGMQDERGILAIYSTRAAADAALRFGNENTTVEEHALDGPLPSAPPGHSLWAVQEFNGYMAFRLEAFDVDGIGQVLFDGDSYDVDIWAQDEEHALRIGSEKIDAFKAMQAMP
ncbi:MAG: hypothetical protein ABI599_03125 [Flavobacteriales bacterium]